MSWNKETSYYRKNNNFKKRKNNLSFEMEVEDVLKLKSGDWDERGLRKSTLDHFGVKLEYRAEEGSLGNPIAVYFPFYDKKLKKVIGYQKKDLLIDKEADYHFSIIGTVSRKNPMFGQNVADTSANYLYICEGMVDALSMYQVLLDGAGDGYKDRIAVVSVHIGAPNARNSVLGNLDFINNYKGSFSFKGEKREKGIISCMDNDFSEPDKKDIKGHEATEEMAGVLQDIHFRVLDHPNYMNDVNQYLEKGKEKLLFNLAVFRHKEYHPDKIVRLYDVYEEGDLFKPIEKGVYLPSFPLLMERWLGIRLHELTLILGDSGSGKSSVAFDMGFEYNSYESKKGRDAVGGFFIEDSLRKTNQRALARKMEIHPNIFKFHPPEYNKEVEQWVNDNFILFRHFGSIPIHKLVDYAKMFIHKYERRIIILDHISLVISGSKVEDERKSLDRAMTELATLCEEFPVHIFVVCHINRGASVGIPREIKEPYWKRVYTTDARGSSGLEGLSSNIICIDTEKLPNMERGRIRLNLLKNREADKLGICDTVIMDKKTGLFIDASMMEYSDERGLYMPDNNDFGY